MDDKVFIQKQKAIQKFLDIEKEYETFRKSKHPIRLRDWNEPDSSEETNEIEMEDLNAVDKEILRVYGRNLKMNEIKKIYESEPWSKGFNSATSTIFKRNDFLIDSNEMCGSLITLPKEAVETFKMSGDISESTLNEMIDDFKTPDAIIKVKKNFINVFKAAGIKIKENKTNDAFAEATSEETADDFMSPSVIQHSTHNVMTESSMTTSFVSRSMLETNSDYQASAAISTGIQETRSFEIISILDATKKAVKSNDTLPKETTDDFTAPFTLPNPTNNEIKESSMSTVSISRKTLEKKCDSQASAAISKETQEETSVKINTMRGATDKTVKFNDTFPEEITDDLIASSPVRNPIRNEIAESSMTTGSIPRITLETNSDSQALAAISTGAQEVRSFEINSIRDAKNKAVKPNFTFPEETTDDFKAPSVLPNPKKSTMSTGFIQRRTTETNSDSQAPAATSTETQEKISVKINTIRDDTNKALKLKDAFLEARQEETTNDLISPSPIRNPTQKEVIESSMSTCPNRSRTLETKFGSQASASISTIKARSIEINTMKDAKNKAVKSESYLSTADSIYRLPNLFPFFLCMRTNVFMFPSLPVDKAGKHTTDAEALASYRLLCLDLATQMSCEIVKFSKVAKVACAINISMFDELFTLFSSNLPSTSIDRNYGKKLMREMFAELYVLECEMMEEKRRSTKFLIDADVFLYHHSPLPENGDGSWTDEQRYLWKVIITRFELAIKQLEVLISEIKETQTEFILQYKAFLCFCNMS